MNPFDERLLRLKLELRVSEDGDVAEQLGFSRAGFSSRKIRGVFPYEALFDLAERMQVSQKGGQPPLDVVYVIAGVRLRGHLRVQAESALRLAVRTGDEASIESLAALTAQSSDQQSKLQPQYEQLLDWADQCDETHLKLLLDVAQAIGITAMTRRRVGDAAAQPVREAKLAAAATDRPKQVFNGPVGEVQVKGHKIRVGRDVNFGGKEPKAGR